MEKFIQLAEDDSVLKLAIKDSNGEETGESLVFNLQDIELLTKYQDLIEKDKRNRLYLKNQFEIIDKKQDHSGKKLLSANEEAKVKAMQEFYKKETEIYNIFLGDRGVEKLLNGRELSWNSLEMIDRIIEEQIMPQLKANATDIKADIMKKYSKKQIKEENIIE
jgi:hypothetical protein